MDTYRNLEFKNGYFENIDSNKKYNDELMGVYSVKIILNNIERDTLPMVNGYSVITLDDLNINIYQKNIATWKKINGSRGTGVDPYSPRSTGIFAIGNTCYSVNVETTRVEFFQSPFLFDKTWAAGCSNGCNDRGIFGGNLNNINNIECVNVSTCNSSLLFGNLSFGQYQGAASSNGINNRGIFAGGWNTITSMCYVNIGSFGNALNFGGLSYGNICNSCTSNATGNRGLIIGNRQDSGWILGSYMTASYYPSHCSRIDYISISTPSNSSVFGYLNYWTTYSGSVSNNEYNRTIKLGGYYWDDPSPIQWTYNQGWWYVSRNYMCLPSFVEYISMNNLCNGTAFGNLINSQTAISVVSNGVRNRGISYGNNSSTTSGSMFSFLHIGGTVELIGSLISTSWPNGYVAISNS